MPVPALRPKPRWRIKRHAIPSRNHAPGRLRRSRRPEVIRLETGPVPQPALVRCWWKWWQRASIGPTASSGPAAIPRLPRDGRTGPGNRRPRGGAREGVTSPALGDEVCALVISGGYAEYCLARRRSACPSPSRSRCWRRRACRKTITPSTTTSSRADASQKARPSWFIGGSSGIGSTAIQLAHQPGRVIATAGSDEKCAFCRELGADETINYRAADFVEEVKRSPTDRA